MLAGLLEEIAPAGGAHADEHLDEFRAGDREEGDAGLAGHGARQQGLARARRPDQQDALGQTCTEPAVRVGSLEEVDDLLELRLGLVDTGHVVEGDARAALEIDARLALADRQQAAAGADPALQAADDEQPDADEQRRRHHPRQDGLEPARVVLGLELHLVLGEIIGNVERQPVGDELRLLACTWLGKRAANVGVTDSDFRHLAGVEQRAKLAVRNLVDPLVLHPEVAQQRDRQQRDHQVDEVYGVAVFHVHLTMASIRAGALDLGQYRR